MRVQEAVPSSVGEVGELYELMVRVGPTLTQAGWRSQRPVSGLSLSGVTPRSVIVLNRPVGQWRSNLRRHGGCRLAGRAGVPLLRHRVFRRVRRAGEPLPVRRWPPAPLRRQAVVPGPGHRLLHLLLLGQDRSGPGDPAGRRRQAHREDTQGAPGIRQDVRSPRGHGRAPRGRRTREPQACRPPHALHRARRPAAADKAPPPLSREKC